MLGEAEAGSWNVDAPCHSVKKTTIFCPPVTTTDVSKVVGPPAVAAGKQSDLTPTGSPGSSAAPGCERPAMARRCRPCVKGEGPDVIGDVDVLGKPPYPALGLQKRRSSLEHQILFEGRREKTSKVRTTQMSFFEQVRRPTDSAPYHGEGITPVAVRQGLERDLSHGKPGR